MKKLRKLFKKLKRGPMNNGFNASEVESIRAPWFKPSEYVIIQSEMTAGDDAWIQDQLVRTEVGKELKKQGMNVKIQVGSVKLATLKRMVKGWNILRTVKQQDGSVVEVPLIFSPENVDRLPKPYYDFIANEISNRNPDMSEQEEQDFLPPASNVIEANQI
jgi:hypothetical protein